MAEKEVIEKPTEEKPIADKESLLSTGNGVWRYSTVKHSLAEVKDKGYFEQLKARFGIRQGDIILINASGQAGVLGV